jgi:glycosyltransferase involved in cell wall biosynthesis
VNEYQVRKPELRLLQKFAKSFYGGEEGQAAIEIFACNHPIAALQLRSILGSSGLIQIEQIWSALFPLLYAKLRGKTTILDDHNVEALLAARLASSVSNRGIFAAWTGYVAALERICCQLADQIVVTSELDKQNLSRLQGIPINKIRVIPNGTDLVKYRPEPNFATVTRKLLDIRPSDPILTFVGRASYPPNKLAIEYIKNTLSPLVWEKQSNAIFLIVSRELPRSFLTDLDPRIRVISDRDDYPYINTANLCLAPLSVGGGTRIKILNYLACGKAVVTTPIGVEGIPIVADKHVILSNLDTFHNTVIESLDDAEKLIDYGIEARGFAEQNCSWEKSVRMFESLHSELAMKNGV